MKKILCDKDGKFLSVHDGDCILAELEDGNCLTHEDGTIVIYKESEENPLLENIYFHAYYKNGGFFCPKNNSSFYDYVSCGYRFSTEEEKERMYKILFENNLYYDEKEKCLKKIRWRAKKNCMYYYIDFSGPNPFCVTSSMEMFDYIDNYRFNVHNYFQTEEEAEKKLSEFKSILAK
jgi:hypothetical protein